ncbi:unnamed protein product, partial [Brassica rapa subsp. trilocularis]
SLPRAVLGRVNHKERIIGDAKLPGSDSRINCDSSFCGKRLCGLVETSGSSFFLLCLSFVLSS